MINLNKYHLTIENKKAQKLVKFILSSSYIFCLFSLLILACNNTYYISKDFFELGIICFRTGLFAAVFSIICGIFFSNYQYLKN